MAFNHTLRLYDALHKYIKNEDDSRNLAASIEEMVAQYVQLEMEKFATRVDVLDLKTDIIQLKARMKQAFKTHLRHVAALFAAHAVLMLAAIFLLLRFG